MTDSRSRFEAWIRSKSPSVKDWFFGFNTETDGEYQSIWLQHQWEAWQAAEAETARRCVEIVRQWEYSGTYISDSIKAEFPEAFK